MARYVSIIYVWKKFCRSYLQIPAAKYTVILKKCFNIEGKREETEPDSPTVLFINRRYSEMCVSTAHV